MIDNAEKMMLKGAPIAAERISGVNDNMLSSHYHHFYELYYLESGQRYHLINDSLYEIEAGQFILLEPYVLHHSYGEEDVPFCRLLIYFREDEIISTELMQVIKGSSGAYKLPKDESRKFYQLINMIHTEVQAPQQFKDEYCRSLLNTMLIILFRNKRQRIKQAQKSMITDVISYINANYMSDLSLKAISQHFYISPSYICRKFKFYTNSTLIEYINKTRISHAQQLLSSTNATITDISINTGFSNLSHFGRVFKEITGYTPSKWRKCRNSFN